MLHLNCLHRKIVIRTEKTCVAFSKRAIERLASSTNKCMSMPARDFGVVGVVPPVNIAFWSPIAYSPYIWNLSEFVAGHNGYCAFSGTNEPVQIRGTLVHSADPADRRYDRQADGQTDRHNKGALFLLPLVLISGFGWITSGTNIEKENNNNIKDLLQRDICRLMYLVM